MKVLVVLVSVLLALLHAVMAIIWLKVLRFLFRMFWGVAP